MGLPCLPLALAVLLHILAAVATGREILQTSGSSEPLSATPEMLVNDPQGRGHLLALLQSPERYQSRFQWTFTAANFNVDPSIDPGNGIPESATAAEVGSFRVVGSSGAEPIHALPFANDLLLFLQRGSNGNGTSYTPALQVDGGRNTEMAAIYNMTSNTFTPYHITEHPFCAGHTLLPDGHSALIVGGDNLNIDPPFLTNGIQTIRIFDSLTQQYRVVGELDRGRWYPTLMTMPDGNILIIGGVQQEGGAWGPSDAPSDTDHPIVSCSANTGGTSADPKIDNPSYSIFYPENNTYSPALTLTILLKSWPINLYPYTTVLPTGSTLVIAGSLMEAMYLTPNGATADTAVGNLPTLPIPVNYPQYNSLALLPLEPPNYEARFLLAGGAGEFCSNQKTPAWSSSFLVDVTPGANHSLITEKLAFPRVMGDLVTLPDGTVLLCNGAQVGIAGGGGPNLAAAGVGTTVCELYDPRKPIGQRWSTLGDSGIWRLYHSWAFLTKNATVLIGGSESTAEKRIQVWTPPYLLSGKPRPQISNVPANITYQERFSFNFRGVQDIDGVVLHRLSGATHGIHFDQRQIVLECSTTAAMVGCAAPPNSSIGPPGLYMLFALSSGVPSVAPFVLLQPSSAAANVSPASGPSFSQAG